MLLLGSWGPQKDLPGILGALTAAHDQGGRFRVSVAGAINAHFPDYKREVDRTISKLDSGWFTSLGEVPESELLRVVLGHDLLILPYNATGGYSGAMSLGAYCGTGIIAYDLPQLRESASLLGVRPVFIPKGDRDAAVTAILAFCDNIVQFRATRARVPRPEFDAMARASVSRLLDGFSTSK